MLIVALKKKKNKYCEERGERERERKYSERDFMWAVCEQLEEFDVTYQGLFASSSSHLRNLSHIKISSTILSSFFVPSVTNKKYVA